MIPGVIGQVPAVPIGLPAAAGSFDFVHGAYSWGATTLIASQVVNQTGWIGGSGLAVPASGAAGAHLLYASLGTLLATSQFACVAEIQATAGNGKQIILTVANSGAAFYIELDYWADFFAIDSDGTNTRSVENSLQAQSSGTWRVAMSRTDARLAISVAGANPTDVDGTAATTPSPMLPVGGFPMVNFYLGGYSDNTQAAVNIHNISFYNSLTDAQMRILSE